MTPQDQIKQAKRILKAAQSEYTQAILTFMRLVEFKRWSEAKEAYDQVEMIIIRMEAMQEVCEPFGFTSFDDNRPQGYMEAVEKLKTWELMRVTRN